jgi:hypothetical protein
LSLACAIFDKLEALWLDAAERGFYSEQNKEKFCGSTP